MLESAPPGNAVIAAPASPPRLRVGPPRDWAAGFPGVDPTICRFSSLAAPGQLQSPLVRRTLALSRAERAQRAREPWPSNATPGRRLERVVRHHRFPASVSFGLRGTRPKTTPTTTPRPMSMRPRPGRLHTDQRPNRKQLTATMPPAIRDTKITMCLALSFVQRSLIAVGLDDS